MCKCKENEKFGGKNNGLRVKKNRNALFLCKES